MWDRSHPADTVDTSGVFGAVIGQTLFDPTSVVAGNQDLRVTVRRIRLSFYSKLVVTAGGQAALAFISGIYVARAGEPDRDPGYPAAADQRTDWMWHSAGSPFIPATAAVVIATGGAASTFDGADVLSVRAMRKLDQDEVIRMVAKYIRVDIGGDGAPTVTRQILSVYPSVLYSRTMR